MEDDAKVTEGSKLATDTYREIQEEKEYWQVYKDIYVMKSARARTPEVVHNETKLLTDSLISKIAPVQEKLDKQTEELKVHTAELIQKKWPELGGLGV